MNIYHSNIYRQDLRHDKSIPCKSAWQIYTEKDNFRTKKLYRTNKRSNFLGASYSNRKNITDPIQLRRERKSQNLKKRKVIDGQNQKV